MSDLQSNKRRRQCFLLGEIAPYLEKDQRTLRRWCQLGLVPGARRTRGGHWRIYGTDRASVLRAIRGRVSFGAGDALAVNRGRRHRARRRRENAYPQGMAMSLWRDKLTPRQAWLKVPAGEFAARTAHRGRWVISDQRSRSLRRGADRARLLEDLVSALREHRTDRPDMNDPWITQQLEKSALQQLIDSTPAAAAKDILGANETWEKSGKGWRLTVAQLASMLGISRRTFYRWFPGWRRIVFDNVVREHSAAAVRTGEATTDYDPHQHAKSIDTALGWREPGEKGG